MRISIILPTRDRIKYLKEFIESTLEQDYTNWELMIIDDYESKEKAEGLINSFKDDRIKYLTGRKHDGIQIDIGNAINEGIKKSTGDLVTNIGDDDLWYDNTSFSKRVKIFQDLEPYKIEVLFCTGVNIGMNGKVQNRIVPPNVSVTAMLKKYYINSCAMMWKKSVNYKIGGFCETVGCALDQELKWRFLMECNCISYDYPVAKHRFHMKQISRIHKANGNIQKNKVKIREMMYSKYKWLFKE